MIDDQETRALVEAAQRGDRDALGRLMDAHLPRLRAFVRLMGNAQLRELESASDLVQSACRQALEHLNDYEWRGPGSFRAWLFRLASNKIRNRRNFHRAARRRPSALQYCEDLSEIYATLTTPSDVAIAREQAERLESAMEELPVDYREVIVLNRIVGLAHRETAERLGRTEQATRALLSRALARLATRMSRA